MSHARNKVYVDRIVQGALARRIVLHWCVFFALTVISLVALELFLGDPGLTMSEHLRTLWSKYAFLLILMVAIVPTFIYDSMKLSNRFVGPVLRLHDSIRALAKGEPVRELKFRDSDFWQEISEDFNVVASRIREHKA